MKTTLTLSSLGSRLGRLVPRPLSWTHQGAIRFMEKVGFQKEIRRQGELTVTLWRLRRSAGPGSAASVSPHRRLVFLPGLGDSPISWLPVWLLAWPRLKGRLDELVLVDLPGYPGHQFRSGFFSSVDALLDSLGDVLDELKPGVIMGHSMGGWLTGFYAAQVGAGERPRHRQTGYAGPEEIILTAPSGLFAREMDKEAFREIFRQAAGREPKELLSRLFHRAPPWFRLFSSEVAAFPTREDVRSFLLSMEERHSMEGRAEKIRARTWLLWGDQDQLCRTEWTHEWLKRLPAETRPAAVLLKGAGHSPHLERTWAVAQALTRILTDQPLVGFLRPQWRIVRA